MKILQENNTVDSNGISETTDFSIKTNPAAFQLLSSGLYSNKVRAVIRELCCNAVDAHAMIGMNSLPIEIKLPNAIDTQFFVKDFGPGMSHDQIMRLYTTYFDSTKRESNDFIGGFGVGSKSPFAYTDSFTVESRQDGKMRTYTAYVDDGFPKIAFMSGQETSDANGLTVGFPVKPIDFDRFKSEALDVLQWFAVKPTVTGISEKIPETNYIKLSNRVSVPGVSKNNSRGVYHSPMLRMGNVVYPLTKFYTQVENNDPNTDIFEWIRLCAVVIEADIGSVSVAASREDIAYDKKTIESLRLLLTEAYDVAINDVIEKVQKLDPNSWEDRRSGNILLKASRLDQLMSKKLYDSNALQKHPSKIPLINKALAARNIDSDTFLPFLYASQVPDMSKYPSLELNVVNNSESKVHTWRHLRGASIHSGGGVDMPSPGQDVTLFVDDIPEKSAWAQKAWKAWRLSNTNYNGGVGRYANRATGYVFVVTPRENVDLKKFESEKEELIKALGNIKESPPLSSGLDVAGLKALKNRAEQSIVAATFFTDKPTRVYEGKPFYYVIVNAVGQVVAPKDLNADEKSAYLSFAGALMEKDYGELKILAASKEFLESVGVPTTRIYRVKNTDEELVKTMVGAKSLVDSCISAIKKPNMSQVVANLGEEVDIGQKSPSQNPLASVLYAASYTSSKNLISALPGTKLGTLVENIKKYALVQEGSTLSKKSKLFGLLNDLAGKPLKMKETVRHINSLRILDDNYPMLPSFLKSASASNVPHINAYIAWCEKERSADPKFLQEMDFK